jgi:hypothetical protein
MTYEESMRKDLRMLKSAKAKREFMNGFRFSLRMVGFQFKLYGDSQKIIRNDMEFPNMQFQVNNFIISSQIDDKDLKMYVALKEVKTVTSMINS